MNNRLALLTAPLAEASLSLSVMDDPNYRDYAFHTYGADFAEVGVDADTAEIRLRRMLGVFSVGRVLNAKTARFCPADMGQVLAGMTVPGRAPTRRYAPSAAGVGVALDTPRCDVRTRYCEEVRL